MESTTTTSAERPHVVLLASPGAGHLIPLAELARRLVDHHGFAATLVTFTNLSLPAHVLASCALPPSVATVALPAVDMSDIPAGLHIDLFVQLTRRSLPSLRALLRARPAPAALVPDFLCSEALLVAAELGVPGYVFVPTNLAWLALRRQLLDLHRGLPPGEHRDLPEVLDLGAPVRRADLPSVYRDPERLAFPELLEGTRRYLRADGFLVDTFEEMEPALLDAFTLAAEQGAFPPVFAVGPLVRRPKPEPEGSEPDVDGQKCLEWLDRQPAGSVVFASFGSGGALSLGQTAEVAAGLEDSGQRFLWVVRMPKLTTSESETAAGDGPLAWLPKGFLERTAGRGLAVAAWAPQARVLSHPATAAFASHCGWNSALESVRSGVPMVALPLGAEQRMNAVILAGEKVGVALLPPARGDGVVPREGIAAAVKELLVEGEKGRAVRRRAADMQQAAARAWLPGGSSRRALEDVAARWKAAWGSDGAQGRSDFRGLGLTKIWDP